MLPSQHAVSCARQEKGPPQPRVGCSADWCQLTGTPAVLQLDWHAHLTPASLSSPAWARCTVQRAMLALAARLPVGRQQSDPTAKPPPGAPRAASHLEGDQGGPVLVHRQADVLDALGRDARAGCAHVQPGGADKLHHCQAAVQAAVLQGSKQAAVSCDRRARKPASQPASRPVDELACWRAAGNKDGRVASTYCHSRRVVHSTCPDGKTTEGSKPASTASGVQGRVLAGERRRLHGAGSAHART